jgi:hypothetical protein
VIVGANRWIALQFTIGNLKSRLEMLKNLEGI